MADDGSLLPLLGRITRALSSDRPLESVLRSVARRVAAMTDADTCSIMLLDDQRRELLFKEAYGLPRREIERIRFRMGEGIAGWVALKRKAARVADVSKDRRFKSFPEQTTRIVSLLCVPLAVRGRVLGVVSMNSARRGAFGARHQAILEHLAGHLALEIENHRLYELSVTDGLTQLFNRRYFLRKLEDEIGRAERVGEPLALCIADLDRFKRINDEHGHPAGDEVLVAVARRFRQKLRAYDIAARYGGDEFAFLFLDAGRHKIQGISSRLGDSLREKLETGAGSFDVSASLGFSVYPEDGDDAKSLLAAADEALYRAKRTQA